MKSQTCPAAVKWFLAACLLAGLGDGVRADEPNRLEPLDKFVGVARMKPWGEQLFSVPAKAFTKGPFKDVPYLALRSGSYELNVFGDPTRPVGVEFAVQAGGNRAAAKLNGVDYLQSVLRDPFDRAILRSLDLQKDWVLREGLTFEVVSDDQKNADRSWRIAVYDQKQLKTQHADEASFRSIADRREEAFKAIDRLVSAAAEKRARELAMREGPLSPLPRSHPWAWSPSSGSQSPGGAVWVAPHVRSDGTYVNGHFRSRPDGNRSNNWSQYPNVNPYTGKVGTRKR
jgi:hypothetical protein